jgi:hypothetical protein
MHVSFNKNKKINIVKAGANRIFGSILIPMLTKDINKPEMVLSVTCEQGSWEIPVKATGSWDFTYKSLPQDFKPHINTRAGVKKSYQATLRVPVAGTQIEVY